MADRKWGSTEVVKCRECEFDDRERYARVIVYEDGDVEVHCSGGCLKCKYKYQCGNLTEGGKGVRNEKEIREARRCTWL